MLNQSISKESVLISGASIAGLILAYWLSNYSFDVTVVERFKKIRRGGCPIDVRGTAVDVGERMGILSQLQKADIHTGRITFLHPNGDVVGSISPENATGSEKNRDIELSRGSLTEILYNLTKHQSIRYQFDDSISSLDDNGDTVDVTFKSGQESRFDIVIGADGLHSNTRRLVFDKEETYSRYLGYCFSGFTIANDFNLSQEAVVYSTPGRTAAIYATDKSNMAHVLFGFASEEQPDVSHRDDDQQRKLMTNKFAGLGWKIPDLVKAMQKVDDLYYDNVSQIRMPHWSAGRVALVGDAAFAPSFMSGQGSSLALVGAYILAGELAHQENVGTAFSNYEKIMRPFVEANQDLAYGGASSFLFPNTNEELEMRNQAIVALESSSQGNVLEEDSKDIYSSLILPEYE